MQKRYMCCHRYSVAPARAHLLWLKLRFIFMCLVKLFRHECIIWYEVNEYMAGHCVGCLTKEGLDGRSFITVMWINSFVFVVLSRDEMQSIVRVLYLWLLVKYIVCLMKSKIQLQQELPRGTFYCSEGDLILECFSLHFIVYIKIDANDDLLYSECE